MGEYTCKAPLTPKRRAVHKSLLSELSVFWKKLAASKLTTLILYYEYKRETSFYTDLIFPDYFISSLAKTRKYICRNISRGVFILF
jgi:hypothetical protein